MIGINASMKIIQQLNESQIHYNNIFIMNSINMNEEDLLTTTQMKSNYHIIYLFYLITNHFNLLLI